MSKFAYLLGAGVGITYAWVTPYAYADVLSEQPIHQDLYLEVTLNNAPVPDIFQFTQEGSSLFTSLEILQKLGINTSGLFTPQTDIQHIDLKTVAGLTYEYDEAAQKLNLHVSLNLLNRKNEYAYDNKKEIAKLNPDQQKFGMLMNYDVYAQSIENQHELNLWNEMRLFGVQGGLLSISSSSTFSKSSENNQFRSYILDTYWQKDYPDQLMSLVIGDAQSAAFSWARSTRISGISLSKNYNLQPYRVVTPLLKFKGESILPSTVDLFIDGLKQNTQSISPGQFEIQSKPTLNGAGNAQLVITDINGEQKTLSFKLYGTKSLLQKGLDEWSFNLGVTKLDYATASFHYDDQPLFNGNYRYGLNAHTTVELHSELSPQLGLLGTGVVQQLGTRGGVVNAAYAYSQHQEDQGGLYQLGYSWSSRNFNFSYNTFKQRGTYTDIAGLMGYAFPEKMDQVYLGFYTRFGQFGGSYIAQRYALDHTSSRYASFTWSQTFQSHANLSLSYNYNIEQRQNEIYLGFSFPWAQRKSVTVSTQNTAGRQQSSATFMQSINQDRGGWGGQLRVNQYDDGQNYLGRLGYLGNSSEMAIELQQSQFSGQQQTAISASLDGSLLWMGGQFAPMRRSLGAFALVSTSGIPHVPVMLENRNVGYTNDQGFLLVNSLNAYQHNKLSIDTLKLPLDLQIKETQLDGVPRQSSGILVNFPIYKMISIQMQVIDIHGNIVEMGSPVFRSSDQQEIETVVGREGIVYFENPAQRHFFIQNNHQHCQITLPELKNKSGFVDLGKVTCQ